MPRELAEPWRSFLANLDARLEQEVRLHCCGGFVVTAVYGLPRTTADLDVLAVVPADQQRELARLAGRASTLHQTHGVYLDVVTVATLPDSYEERLTAFQSGRFRHLRLLILDPYDLVLAKMTRNADRDRGRDQQTLNPACTRCTFSKSASSESSCGNDFERAK